ncbi:MAG: OmpA family protein [Desulforegulaceae bacterium]|nr:OmpA family protein [Desulforegulaceae bacterium]
MKFFKTTAIALFAIGFLVSGCSVKQCSDLPAGNPPVFDGSNYSKKVDNLIIIADTSSSMEQCSGNHTCFSATQNIITKMISALPSDIDINSAYLTYGHLMSISPKPNLVNLELSKFSKSRFNNAQAKVSEPGGTSRLDLSIDDACNMLGNTSGKTAIFIFGDGRDANEKVFASIDKIKGAYGNNVCVYPVHVGNSVEGEKVFAGIASSAGCGKFYKAESLNNNEAIKGMLAGLVYTKVLDSDGDGVIDSLDKCPGTPKGAIVDKYGCPIDSDGDGVYDGLDKCPNTPKGAIVDKHGCPIDSDGDGVYDGLDKCPNTPKGTKVDKYGCPVLSVSDKVTITERGTWLYKGIQFGTEKDGINAKTAAALDELAATLKENKNIKLEVQGYTDSTGNSAYNYKLSEKRADSVKKYLENKGISSNRLVSKGYGPSNPRATNKTVEGRALNRRVEFKPLN